MKVKAVLMHTKTVLKHKKEVFRLCTKCGMPIRGMFHDMSKFGIVEFKESVKYYDDGKKSPLINARATNGYSLAWIHHKNKNKHHIEYWFDFYNKEQTVMPYRYAVEYICDKIAAAKTYNSSYTGEGIIKYIRYENERAKMNPKLKQFFHTVFNDIDLIGEKKVLNARYLKEKYKNIVETNKPKEEENSLSM